MQRSQITVGMAQVRVEQGPALYDCVGLGSCIAIAMNDPEAEVSGMGHIMLPQHFGNGDLERAGKFADSGIDHMVKQLVERGALLERLRCAYSGGAQVFRVTAGQPHAHLAMGERNAEAVAKKLGELGILVVATDVGGAKARSVSFCSSTGEFRVRSLVGGEKILCNLH